MRSTEPNRMKVLVVTFAFPPANVIGAVRVGKLARYLDSRGHDVRVLTTDVIEDRSLPLEIAEERVLYTDYRRPGHRQPAEPGGRSQPDEERRSRRHGLRSFLRRHYDGLRNIPDMRIDWKNCAISAGRRLIEGWRPDVIFASAPPYTGLIVAARLARAFGIPWIADLRDLWVDNPYYEAPFWRRPIDAVIERHTLRDAAKLVTVSPSWAGQLRQRHGRAAEVVYNGYAEEDFPPLPPEPDPGGPLTIRYLGSIYPGFRDPSALFAALALLPDIERARVAVEFFCDNPAPVLAAAAAHHVAQFVIVRPRVPYRRALELQMESDVLLLLQSIERRDEGNIPAKLFEYLYARRPILFIGYELGIAARLVIDRDAGLVSNAPLQICDRLQDWIAQKEAGRLSRLDATVCLGLGRDEQFHKLEHLLSEVCKRP